MRSGRMGRVMTCCGVEPEYLSGATTSVTCPKCGSTKQRDVEWRYIPSSFEVELAEKLAALETRVRELEEANDARYVVTHASEDGVVIERLREENLALEKGSRE